MINPRMACPLAIAAVLTATAGCGGSSSPSASSTPPGVPKPAALSSPETSAAAAKINLVAADLPGFKASPADDEEDAQEKQAEKELAKCVGAPNAESDSNFSSDDFTQGQGLPSLTVSSEVAFEADPAEVKQDSAAFKSAKAPACLQAYLRKAIAAGAQGATLNTPAITRLNPAAAGDATYGFRMVTGVDTGGQKIPITFDLLGVAKGRTEVTLSFACVGAALPEAQRDALFAKLAARTEANAL
jgi:hypothetical protein